MNLLSYSSTALMAGWLALVWSALAEYHAQCGLRQVRIAIIFSKFSKEEIPHEVRTRLLQLLIVKQYLVFTGGEWYWFFAEKPAVTVELATSWLSPP